MHLLLIDDDPETRFLVEYVLSAAGMRVTGVAGASDALAALRAGADFDGVLLDVELEGERGDVLLPRLRAAGLAVPVVFLTGHGDAQSVAGLRAAGGADVIAKPFDAERLVPRVRALFGASP